ncbi:MAG TPA: hypothetical protein VNT42_03240, partial [Sphingomonas sp.]|nr:hypothetical protein [Sphingomonas sp.]
MKLALWRPAGALQESPARVEGQAPSGPRARRSFGLRGKGLRLASLKFELIGLLLLVATFAAVMGKGAIVDRNFSLRPSDGKNVGVYWFSDASSGGKSTAALDPHEPFSWSCELRPVFSYPFCALGILLDPLNPAGAGHDLSRYDKVEIELNYQGSAKLLKFTIKNREPRQGTADTADTVKPIGIEFPVEPGFNKVELNLSEAKVEQWWVFANPKRPQSAIPRFDHVIGFDIQTGSGTPSGHHAFTLKGINLRGSVLSPEHWYLIILGFWTGLAAIYLGFRISSVKRALLAKRQAYLEEQRRLREAWDAAESASQSKS